MIKSFDHFNFRAFWISTITVLLIGLMCILADGESVGAFLLLSMTVGTGYGIIFGIALQRKEKENG